ncbi:hypothetical protein QO009_002736 [Brevibacillus aydinogluensis]|nr:hypothetical protein [Brevibacillus aydinogluensis]
MVPPKCSAFSRTADLSSQTAADSPVTQVCVANYLAPETAVHPRNSGAMFGLIAYTGSQLPRLSVIRMASLLFPSWSFAMKYLIHPLLYTTASFCKPPACNFAEGQTELDGTRLRGKKGIGRKKSHICRITSLSFDIRCRIRPSMLPVTFFQEFDAH